MVSITKRCTDCFRGERYKVVTQKVSITKRCTDCFQERIYARIQVQTFQSPNGVQIAFEFILTYGLFPCRFNHQTVYRLLYYAAAARFAQLRGFNHQTVYRLLFRAILAKCEEIVSITKRCTDCFSVILLALPFTVMFQSPNGVQIAFNFKCEETQAEHVSITKRCTDCFQF